jgi:hypothetical protein
MHVAWIWLLFPPAFGLSVFFSSQWIVFSSSQMLSILDYSSVFSTSILPFPLCNPVHVFPLTFPTILLMDSPCNWIYIISLWIHTSIDRPLAFLSSFSLFLSLPFHFHLTSNSVILCTQITFLFNLFLAVITPCIYICYSSLRSYTTRLRRYYLPLYKRHAM